MTLLFQIILFASLFAVPSAEDCIISPDSIDVLKGFLETPKQLSLRARVVRYCRTLACHSDTEPPRKLDDFKKDVEGILGDGGSGLVLKVKVKGADQSTVYAMKVYRLKPENWKLAHNELIISTILSSDPGHRFVKPYYFFLSRIKQEQRLVMEFVSGGTYRELLKRVKRMHWEDTIPLAYLLLQALAYAHSQGVIYRDLKPENILLDAETGFKITDFDIAARFIKDKEYPKDSSGTYDYMAPEYFFVKEPRTETVDTWAVGAVLWNAIEGRRMHDDLLLLHNDRSKSQIGKKFRKLIENSEPIPLLDEIPKEGLGALYRNLLNKLLEYEYELDATTHARKKRLTCAEILKSDANAVFTAYEEKTKKKLTQLAFSPVVDKDELIGYKYFGRQHKHYRDLDVLPQDSNFIWIIPENDLRRKMGDLEEEKVGRGP